MCATTLLTALTALLPLVSASAIPSDFLLGRSTSTIDDLITDDAIFNAFSDAAHPATVPAETWKNNEGEVYQSRYEFDTAEWNDMRISILQKNGLNETDLMARRMLVPRQDQDPPAFFCLNQNTQPKAYTASLSAAVAGVCQGFVYGAERAGKTQIVRRNVPDITNRNLIATFKFAWYNIQWATAAGCGIGMSIGIDEACNMIQEGNEGEQPATSGFTAEDEEVKVGLSFTRV